MIQVPGAGGDEAHDRHKDEALEVVNSEEGLEIDPAVERRVLRKIDLFFMPAMLVGA